MFNYIADKIKGAAKMFLVLGTIGWIVIAIAFSYNWYLEEWNFPLLIGLIIGGILVNYVGCLVLAGPGA